MKLLIPIAAGGLVASGLSAIVAGESGWVGLLIAGVALFLYGVTLPHA